MGLQHVTHLAEDEVLQAVCVARPCTPGPTTSISSICHADRNGQSLLSHVHGTLSKSKSNAADRILQAEKGQQQ